MSQQPDGGSWLLPLLEVSCASLVWNPFLFCRCLSVMFSVSFSYTAQCRGWGSNQCSLSSGGVPVFPPVLLTTCRTSSDTWGHAEYTLHSHPPTGCRTGIHSRVTVSGPESDRTTRSAAVRTPLDRQGIYAHKPQPTTLMALPISSERIQRAISGSPSCCPEERGPRPEPARCCRRSGDERSADGWRLCQLPTPTRRRLMS